MANCFDAALAFCLREEGGYTAEPADRGNWTSGIVGKGELRGTKYGISAAAYPMLGIEALAPAEAGVIYKRDYWDKVRGDDLPAGVDLSVFDMGVNAGVSRSARMLQTIVGVPADGVIGPVTMEAVGKRSAFLLISQLAEAQEAYYRGLETFPKYGNGWLGRVTRRRAAAVALIPKPLTPAAPTAPAPAPQPTGWAAIIAAIIALFRRKGTT